MGSTTKLPKVPKFLLLGLIDSFTASTADKSKRWSVHECKCCGAVRSKPDCQNGICPACRKDIAQLRVEITSVLDADGDSTNNPPGCERTEAETGRKQG